MTDQEKRIFIAEKCGWKHLRPSTLFPDKFVGKPPHSSAHRAIPDYFNDLNACHEAEQFIQENQVGDYSLLLAVVTGDNEWSATARQRAEAFIKTIQ